MSDRKTHWENVYGGNSPLELSWYESEPTVSLQLIHNSQVAHNAPIIDVGGGASTLVDSLCDEGYTNVSVLDISKTALKHAQQRLGDKADEVEWYEEDITRFNPPQQFSIWHDRAVFHFLTEQTDRESYVKVLKRALKPNGHLIIAAFSIGGSTKCSGLDVVQYNAKKLMLELGDSFQLVTMINDVHVTPANKEQQFTYFYLKKLDPIVTTGSIITK